MFMFPAAIPVGGGAQGSSSMGVLVTTRWAIIMSWIFSGRPSSVGVASAYCSACFWRYWAAAFAFRSGLFRAALLGACLGRRVFGGIMRYQDLCTLCIGWRTWS